MLRQTGSAILDVIYPRRLTKERYRAVIGRLNRRIRDFRLEVTRLEATIAQLRRITPVHRATPPIRRPAANDNAALHAGSRVRRT